MYPNEFDNQTLAVLRGRLVRYLMRSKEVIQQLWHSYLPEAFCIWYCICDYVYVFWSYYGYACSLGCLTWTQASLLILQITLGRITKDNTIDVDLALEGPACKISRRQGVIKLKNNGDFYLANEGKRAVYIDGKPVMRGCKHKLANNSVVEVSRRYPY